MSNDCAHGSPRSDIDVNWHIGDDSCVLQGVVINNTNNSIDLKKQKVVRVKDYMNFGGTHLYGFI